METITTASPGSLVYLVHAKIADAVVLSVTIRGNGLVSYEVAWWANGARKVETVDQSEVGYLDGEQPQTLTVGFKG